MEERVETLQSSERPLDFETFRSRVRELSNYRRSDDFSETSPLDSEKLLEECVIHLESKIKQITSEFSDLSCLGPDDLEAYLEHMKEKLKMVEAENVKISEEIEDLTRTYMEDSARFESDLEGLNDSLEVIESQGIDKLHTGACGEISISEEYQECLKSAHENCNFEILELDHQIEKSKVTLSSLKDLDYIFRRVEAIEQIEDALTGVKVIEFEGNCIRLSIRIFLPATEVLRCQQKVEDITEPSVLDHELLIEVMDGSMELKNVEIFPSDVFIGEIVDAAKSFWEFFPSLSTPKLRSSLEWFVRKVQDRILLCTLRQSLVKVANKSRHSFEYSDRDETITAHMVGGIDAFIKVSQGWPVTNSALKLMSLKSSENHSKEISLRFLCKVEELISTLEDFNRS
ncbi:PREDICTED: uncharacterized protein LOC104590200 isoform X2 [Nelumbo nucifera]|uniref:Uncharacterized protein LOC104590200 isoform X2 n=1 Tax=Nelumbo nucifera TaxID=4432 RepID=A0A1U7ZHG5_NELNU|nr:PREDICTED: uncharacterized protein LOC104590200 isoform X2 [Nelumbo nucifera]